MEVLKGVLKRLLAMLSLGYVLYFYSEVMFWARWKPGDTLLSQAVTWLVYSLLAFFVLLLSERYRAEGVDSVFLIGAVFGWLVEGVVVQTAYVAFPFQLVWTPLAWHALITVLLGFYFAGKALGEWELKKSGAFFALMGAFWGFWASYWKLEDGYAFLPWDFALYAFAGTAILAVAYLSLASLSGDEFKPTRGEFVLYGAFLSVFAAVTFAMVPFAPAVLVPLLAIALYSLGRLKGEGSFVRRYPTINPRRLFLLFLMPLSALLTYLPLMDVWIEVNLPVALATSSAGIVLFLKAVYNGLRKRH